MAVYLGAYLTPFFFKGYGTVSECVDTCTPFVYGLLHSLIFPYLVLSAYIVSRPLFIEEHGLRLLMDREGTGIELSRQKYEAGDWSSAVTEAFINGQDMKRRKRYEMANGIGVDKRDQEGRKLAATVTDWVKAWWNEEQIPA